MIFNSIYQLATEAVKDKLRKEGIIMSLPSPSGELWERDTVEGTERARSQNVAHCNVEEILEVSEKEEVSHLPLVLEERSKGSQWSKLTSKHDVFTCSDRSRTFSS